MAKEDGFARRAAEPTDFSDGRKFTHTFSLTFHDPGMLGLPVTKSHEGEVMIRAQTTHQAVKDGRLRPGDVVLEVNGLSIACLDYTAAKDVIKDAKRPLEILFGRRDVAAGREAKLDKGNSIAAARSSAGAGAGAGADAGAVGSGDRSSDASKNAYRQLLEAAQFSGASSEGSDKK